MPITYAIGDIHGRRDLLEALLARIARDAAARGAPWRIVFNGDVVDRGPESCQALGLVIDTLETVPGSRLILGNHEEFMLRFVDIPEDRPRLASHWYRNGGMATLASYGLDYREPADEVAAALAERFPDHVEALRQATHMVIHGAYAFVHAGVDPQVPITRQDPITTRWIRDGFLDHDGPLGKIVVHGHTPTSSNLPELHVNRIAIDTGAVFAGHLTCAVLADDGADPVFLATDDSGGEIAVTPVRPIVVS